jgi:hypothetical protein
MTGVAREPASSRLLISFVDLCEDGLTFTIERFGLAEYDPATNVVSTPTLVFHEQRPGAGLLPRLALGSPVFIGRDLFFFSSVCTSPNKAKLSCNRGDVFLARVPANRQNWQRASSYRFFDPGVPGDFTKDPRSARSVIRGAVPVVAVTANDYGNVHRGLVLIEETTLKGNFRVWTAPHPTGPWHSTPGLVKACGGGSGLDLCRAMIGHPELSSGSQLVFSYFNPTQNHLFVTNTRF